MLASRTSGAVRELSAAQVVRSLPRSGMPGGDMQPLQQQALAGQQQRQQQQQVLAEDGVVLMLARNR